MFFLFKGEPLVVSGIQYQRLSLRVATAVLLCFSIITTNQALANAARKDAYYYNKKDLPELGNESDEFNESLIASIENSRKNYDFFDYDVQLFEEESPYKEDFPPIEISSPDVPVGYEEWGVIHDCSVEKLGKEIENIGENPELSPIEITSKIHQGLERYFHSPCGLILAERGKHQLRDYAKVINIGYDISKNKKVKEIRLDINTKKLNIPGKQTETIRGLLAIHDDIPRPLVVVKCGIMCSATTDYASKQSLAHIFDQTHFNVLVLSNNTSHEYFLDNGRVSIGGIEEGQQVARILRWLRTESRLKDIISSLHLIGMSQGGQAVLYTSTFLNSNDGAFNKGPEGEMLVNSNLALCPVVNLESSAEYAFTESDASRLMVNTLRDTLIGIKKHPNTPPSVDAEFRNVDSIKASGGFEIISKLLNANADFYNDPYVTPMLPPFTSFYPRNAEEIFIDNNFSAKYIYSRNEGNLSTLIWGAKNDGIIHYEHSGITNLKESLETHPDTKLNILSTDHGQHCGFSLAYGWNSTTEIIRSIVYAHDRKFYDSIGEKEIILDYSEPIKTPDPRYYHADQYLHWKWDGEKASLELRFKLLIPTNEDCKPTDSGINDPNDPNDMGDINAKEISCYKIAASKTNPDGVWYEENFFRKAPTSKVEAEIETRWLNGNAKLFNEKGYRLKHKEDIPRYIRWRAIDKTL